ncbi:MAG: sel1 repeat family protein, partial [Nitrospinae bacterium]|nr:sel1 repeat family protein [Nitrospinota bacterium]
RNLQTAVQWYQKAADGGFPLAQYNVGSMYELGEGVLQNYEKAAEWYQKAADQGHGLAQNYLGALYHQGKGMPQDFVKAHMWYNLAAAKLKPGKDQDMAVKNRDKVTKLLQPEQLTEAQRLAGNWQTQKK